MLYLKGILLLQHTDILVKKGAEADIYRTTWYGHKAILKSRIPKPYRHRFLDDEIRRGRTIHEANIISAAKVAGVESPFIYFVDPLRAEIIMEFIEGENAKDVITSQVCFEIGKYTALLHAKNIIHGDLTTSNFIIGRKLVLLDFGLSYYSTRIEDRAVDIRLIKQVFSSAHVSMYEDAYKSFINGYSSITSENKINKILKNISEIEQRGRYARVV
jgi:TP53 regulating kinase and related kinases